MWLEQDAVAMMMKMEMVLASKISSRHRVYNEGGLVGNKVQRGSTSQERLGPGLAQLCLPSKPQHNCWWDQ